MLKGIVGFQPLYLVFLTSSGEVRSLSLQCAPTMVFTASPPVLKFQGQPVTKGLPEL